MRRTTMERKTGIKNIFVKHTVWRKRFPLLFFVPFILKTLTNPGKIRPKKVTFFRCTKLQKSRKNKGLMVK